MSGAVLVTGGAGSVGRMLVEKLVADGQAVRIFDLPFMDFEGLEDRDGIDIVKGDITDAAQVADAIKGVSSAVHLAALLPPNSERDRDRTFGVNVGGTENIIKAMEAGAQDATLIFTSSISTYGNTMDEEPPVCVDHQQSAIDIYADSKIVGERMVRESSLNWIAMRIAGIMVPAFMEPPSPWPFVAEQRVEMVHRDDVVDALFASVGAPEAANKVLNIAGGPTWQMHGEDYARDFYGFMGAPFEDVDYRESPGWVDWYDTEESQHLLQYQNRSYQHYSDEMHAIVEALMAE
jgi:nucleoside-diphosphate-sugar epimerase